MDPKELLFHESVGKLRTWSVILKILADNKFTDPLLVDESTKTILDGHHRRHAAQIMGLKKIPCWCVRYLDDKSIGLISRRKDISVSKEEIVRRARAGDPYPRKTTRHIYSMPKSPAVSLRRLKNIERMPDEIDGVS